MIEGAAEGIKNIIVTGPARSGTHIAAYWIAEMKKLRYVSETFFYPVWGYQGKELVKHFKDKMEGMEDCVFQLPGVAHFVEQFPECHIVYMIRNHKDVIASQKRINWHDGQLRLNLAPLFNICNSVVSPVEMLYMYWSWQQKKLPSFETWEYERLAEYCPLFVPKEQREGWKLSQVANDIVLNEEEYENAIRDSREWKSQRFAPNEGPIQGDA